MMSKIYRLITIEHCDVWWYDASTCTPQAIVSSNGIEHLPGIKKSKGAVTSNETVHVWKEKGGGPSPLYENMAFPPVLLWLIPPFCSCNYKGTQSPFTVEKSLKKINDYNFQYMYNVRYKKKSWHRLRSFSQETPASYIY